MANKLSAFGRFARGPAGLSVLIGLGLLVRLFAVFQARFDSDEAMSWVVALDLAEGRAFPTLGPGVSNSDAATPGPMFFYVMALAQLGTTSPMGGSVFTAILNLLALIIVFDALRRAWNDHAAFLFLALTVASPWSVTYGDRIWSANLLIPLSALAVWSLIRVLEDEGSRTVAILAFVLITGFQVHILCLHLWPLTLVPLAWRRPRINRTWLFAGVVAGLSAYIPYLASEMTSGFANTRLLLTQGSGIERSLHGLLNMLLQFVSLGTTDVAFLVTQGWWHGFDPLAFWTSEGPARTSLFYSQAGARPLLWTCWLAGWALAVSGLVLVVRSLVKDRRGGQTPNPFHLMFVVGAFSVGALYLVTGRGGFAHYVVILTPIAFTPVIASLMHLNRSRLMALGLAYAVVAPVAGALSLRAHYALDSRQSIPQQQAVIRFIEQEAEGRPFELQFAFREGRAITYQLLARRGQGLRWPVTGIAHDSFTVFLRDQPPITSGRIAATKVFETIGVVHTKR